MISILVVDDDPFVRQGLADMIATDDQLSVVAHASDGADAVRVVRSHDIDVVLMDIRMPMMDGIEATRQIAALPSRPRILVLTTFDLDQHVYSALAAGADGFLLKETPPGEILRAVHVVAAGGSMLHPGAARALIDRFHQQTAESAQAAAERIARLTPRETQVLERVARGDSNADIAETLSMRESTVKAHVSRILTALNVSNRVQAALVARDAQLLGESG
ncbi:response regulator [Rhodococcus oryzae]|uniref:response regulator n=1 Tax=Rhodococcus oryzae TaxID=2571143 RepID=UPI00379E372D